MLRQHQKEWEEERPLQRYLTEMEKPMKALSETERQEWRTEAEAHLESLIAAYEELGSSHDEAVRAALAQFGAAKTIGAKMAKTAQQQNPQRRIVNFVFSCCAIFFFPVLAAFLSFVLLFDYTDNTAAQTVARTLVTMFLVTGPFLCGWLIGRRLSWLRHQIERVQTLQGDKGMLRLRFGLALAAITVSIEFGLFWSLIRVLSEGGHPSVLPTDFLPGLLWLPITLGVAYWRGRSTTAEAVKE